VFEKAEEKDQGVKVLMARTAGAGEKVEFLNVLKGETGSKEMGEQFWNYLNGGEQ